MRAGHFWQQQEQQCFYIHLNVISHYSSLVSIFIPSFWGWVARNWYVPEPVFFQSITYRSLPNNLGPRVEQQQKYSNGGGKPGQVHLQCCKQRLSSVIWEALKRRGQGVVSIKLTSCLQSLLFEYNHSFFPMRYHYTLI